MNRLNKQQKEKVTQFRGITGCSEKIAVSTLQAFGWAVEPALDGFYTNNLGAADGASSQLEPLFNKYKDSDGDSITAEGMMKFCADLGVDPADVVMLVIAYNMNAATMGEFTKDEFMSGMGKMHCSSLESLKSKLPQLRAQLQQEDKFKEVYQYAYLFCREKGQKCVQLDTAIGMWQLLLTGSHAWALLDDWVDFLTKHHNRAVSRDTWNQLYDFIKTIKPDFSNFDESSAWPYYLDEFVEHMRSKRAA